MRDVAAAVRKLGGAAQKKQLVARGARDLDLTRAVKSGDVVRARNGWYTIWPETDPRVRALRVGGRLTGMSAVVALGGWSLDEHPLHVSVHDNAARLRSQWNRGLPLDPTRSAGVMLHWDDAAVAGRGSAASVSLVDALVRVVLDEDFETAVAALDWALHTGRLDRMDLEELILALPAERRGISDWVDARCESLPESLSRTRLRLRGHVVTSQHALDDGKRIDIVVDDCVGLEVDGREHHAESFEPDRSKDFDITLANFHALRPSARMVFTDWDRVVRGIEVALRARGVSAPFGNSGDHPQHPSRNRGISGWRRRPPRRSPEFPKGTREYGVRMPRLHPA